MKKILPTLEYFLVVVACNVLLIFSFSCNLLTGPHHGGGSDSTSHTFIWAIDSIGTQPSVLYNVWGTDINNVYAVGIVILSYSPYAYTAIMRWDGTKWSSSNYLDGVLFGIYGFGTDDFWVVGEVPVYNDNYALISHWDGKSWTTWKLQQYALLQSVWGTSSSNLYAVGWGGLILKYDGTTWTQEQSGTTMNLHSVWGLDDSHIYAAGNQDSTGEGVLLESDGISWKTVAKGGNESDTTLYGGFHGVWSNTLSKIYVVGDLCYEGTPGNWRLSNIPNNAPTENFYYLAEMLAVRGNSSANNVFICGSHDLIIHWNANSWHIYNQFFDKSKQSNLNGIWIKDNSVFIVGYENGENQAIAYRGTQ
ncbi:MAG TPA: hypothetical protein VLX91_01890 [Candidatus Acidoferrales bacterium]|nr:hypothetical protein [Candidatus Acidoferrales bacterium]